ncbi:MAG: family 16 glycoside hydrolase, partial [Pirellula sp.]
MSQLLANTSTPKLLAMAGGLLGTALATVPTNAQEYLNGIEWKAPAVVTPGKTNDAAPSDAIVLFDGKDLSHWKGAGAWKIEDGAMVAGRGSITSVDEF